MEAINLDVNAAKAGSGGSNRIDAKGKYKGRIEFMQAYQTDSGAKFVKFNFISDTDQEAKFKICIFGKTGDPTYGYKQLQAMMACCKIRSLTPVQRVVKDYNYETGEMEDMERTIYKEFDNAKLGLALVRHDKPKYSDPSQMTYEMEIAAPFNYDTEQVSQELLDKQPAKLLERIIKNMQDRKTNPSASNSSGYTDYSGVQEASGVDPFSDDVPF